jgi:hypothetical protein
VHNHFVSEIEANLSQPLASQSKHWIFLLAYAPHPNSTGVFAGWVRLSLSEFAISVGLHIEQAFFSQR